MANSAFNHSPTIVVPGASTNDAVVRWDGTGALTFQNSVFVVSDAGVISGVTQISIDNIRIYDNSIISTNSNGSINLTPDGTGSVVISKVDINAGDIAGVTISGGLTWSAAQNFSSQALTGVNIDSGDISAATISGGLTWSAAQDFNSQNLTNVDIDSGTIDGATIGASSASSVVATTIQLTSGSPSDGKVLTATDNSGNTAWEDAAAGGANVGLSNLSSVAVNATINMNNNELLNIGASGNDLTSSGLSCKTNGARISAQNVTNAGVSSVGDFGSISVANDESFTFTISDGCFFIVQNGSVGSGACFFGQWASGTIEMISAGGGFTPSSTDNGNISVYTTSNNSNVTVMNRTGGTRTIRCLILGPVTSATAPA